MTLVAEYRQARHAEDVARLRRVLTLRALAASGMSQRQIAAELGITQPAVSQQLKHAPDLSGVHPEVLLEAAAPVLTTLAEERGYRRLAVFGSVARRQARPDSDIDLIVEPPPGTGGFALARFKASVEEVLDRPIDLVTWGGLKKRIDDDIRREAVLI